MEEVLEGDGRHLEAHLISARLSLENGGVDAAREALDAAIPKATEAQREFAQAEDEEVLANLSSDENDVHELTQDERKRFADAVAPLVEKHRRVLGDAVFRYID